MQVAKHQYLPQQQRQWQGSVVPDSQQSSNGVNQQKQREVWM
jgi:hypothetical protein